MRLKQDLVHKAEWEVKKRIEEKAAMENALRQCQEALYMEREKIIQTKREVDVLRVKQRKNKRDIQDALSSTNSVEQHVYYDKGQAPEKITSYAKKTMGAGRQQERLEELYLHKKVEVVQPSRVHVRKNNKKAE